MDGNCYKQFQEFIQTPTFKGAVDSLFSPSEIEKLKNVLYLTWATGWSCSKASNKEEKYEQAEFSIIKEEIKEEPIKETPKKDEPLVIVTIIDDGICVANSEHGFAFGRTPDEAFEKVKKMNEMVIKKQLTYKWDGSLTDLLRGR